jgi:1,4-dihydroxy-2-naphthoate polyprenyltransferase
MSRRTARRRGDAAALAAFIRLSRPLFLAGGVVFHGVGVAAALAAGARLDIVGLAWAQAAITATQLVTHFSNEYFDVAADRATLTRTPWSGGSRVLADGRLPPRVALHAAGVCAGVAAAAGLILAARPGVGAAALLLVLVALALAWSYSAPPLRLHSRTLGEVSGALLLAGLTPWLGYYVQAGWPPPQLAQLLAPLLGLQFAMLVTVSLPDAAGDAAVGKQTLAVRLGPRGAARLAAVATLGALAWPLAQRAPGSPILPALAIAAWLPVGAWQAARLWRPAAAPPWSSLSFWGIGLVMGPAASVATALAWWSVSAR